MRYDSRRWTGRPAPGEKSSECANRPYRNRTLRWWLVGVVVLAIGLAVAQVWQDVGLNFGALVIAGLSAASGRSPFARANYRDYDEFEKQALMQAHHRAYTTMMVLALTAMGWCALASHYGWPMPRQFSDWATWAAALLVIGTNLPVLLAEFAIPFPDQEDAA